MMKLNIQKFASITFTGPEVTGNYSWAKIQGRAICTETYVGTANENYSNIKVEIQARVTTGGTTAANWRCGATVNGVTKTAKSPSNMTIDSNWKTINTLTFDNITHNEDGTKKVAISGYAQAPEYPTSLGDAKSSFSGEMELTTIARASTLDSFSGSKRIGVNNDVIINFTKRKSTFTTTLAYATKEDLSDLTIIVEKTSNASTYSWTIPISLLNKIPNSKTLDIYVMLATFDGDTQIGTAQIESFTANAYADNCKPIWETHTIEETDTFAKTLVTTQNKFIANLSKPKFTFEATGQYGATIKYYQVNNTTRTSGFTDSAFNINGYTLKVVDSRGIENTYKFDLTYVPYFTPIFEEVKLFRDVPTSNKVFSYFKIKFFNNTSDVKFDNPQALSYRFNYQESGGDEQETSITPETYDIETSRYAENETELGNTFNYKKSVDWTFSFIDLTGKTFTTNATLPMGIPLMNGKTEEDGEQVLYINGEIKGEGIEPFIKKDTEARLSNVVSKNLFNPNKDVVLINSYYSSSDGNVYSEPEYNCLKIKVQPNKNYVISTNATNFSNISFWDNNFNFKEGLAGNLIYNISVPDDTYYITLAIKNDYTYFQIEEGTTATDYVPYLNLEEAMEKNVVYSTSEQRIGTWIDGKPLYRKVITGTTNLTAGDLVIDLSSLNINYISKMDGTVGTNFDYKPINFYLDGNYISTRYAYGKMYLASTNAYTNLPFTMVLEYTKTTD